MKNNVLLFIIEFAEPNLKCIQLYAKVSDAQQPRRDPLEHAGAGDVTLEPTLTALAGRDPLEHAGDVTLKPTLTALASFQF